METPIRSVPWTTPPPSRPVRCERWDERTFYAFPCAFLLDVPLDMTGCIQAARRAATGAGLDPIADGDVLATDALFRGAVLVQIAADPRLASSEDPHVVRLRGAELLSRELPERPVRLRAELDELARWSRELGHDFAAVYVRYDAPAGGSARPRALFVALRDDSHEAEADDLVDRAG